MFDFKSNKSKILLITLIVLLPFLIWGVMERRCLALQKSNIATARYSQEDRAEHHGSHNAAASPDIMSLQESFVRIAEVVKPAVVNISTVHIEEYDVMRPEFFFGSPFEDFFEDFFSEPRSRKKRRRQSPRERRQRKYEGAGSGVIIDPKGYILTNEHVVRQADEIKVVLSNGKKYNGKVIGKDARTDLAVIKIKASGKLPFAELGDSDRIKVGQWAVAIGSPFGLEQTVTSGIISAVRQSLTIEGREHKNMIQTDAAINRGNSGGPLCNIYGEVIGINSAIYAPTGVFSGVGFAIPINNAKEILDDLIQKGKVVRGWLGVEIRPVDKAVAKHFGLPDAKGVLINRIFKDSPADKAGLKRGDVIRSFDGKKIDEIKQLQEVVQDTKPQTRVKVKVIRDQKEIAVNLVTGEMPQETGGAPQFKDTEPDRSEEDDTLQWQGMTVTKVSEALAKRFDIPDNEQGCVVVNVESDTAAEDMGLMAGDLIRSINRMSTPSISEFRRISKKVKVSDGIVLDVSRQGRLLYITYIGQ